MRVIYSATLSILLYNLCCQEQEETPVHLVQVVPWVHLVRQETGARRDRLDLPVMLVTAGLRVQQETLEIPAHPAALVNPEREAIADPPVKLGHPVCLVCAHIL